jgi:hypothetical protein
VPINLRAAPGLPAGLTEGLGPAKSAPVRSARPAAPKPDPAKVAAVTAIVTASYDAGYEAGRAAARKPAKAGKAAAGLAPAVADGWAALFAAWPGAGKRVAELMKTHTPDEAAAELERDPKARAARSLEKAVRAGRVSGVGNFNSKRR